MLHLNNWWYSPKLHHCAAQPCSSLAGASFTTRHCDLCNPSSGKHKLFQESLCLLEYECLLQKLFTSQPKLTPASLHVPLPHRRACSNNSINFSRSQLTLCLLIIPTLFLSLVLTFLVLFCVFGQFPLSLLAGWFSKGCECCTDTHRLTYFSPFVSTFSQPEVTD